MNGMPWQLSYGASADLDNSELQTDVMRFMAILAFCLVAIFAIVQSMPLESQPVAEPVAGAPPPDESAISIPQPVQPVVTQQRATPKLPKPVVSPPKMIEPAPVARTVILAMPKPPVPQPRSTQPPYAPPKPAVESPVPKPAAVVASKTPATEPAEALTVETPSPARQGLSLRFASDAVLRSLVERRLVSLYAIDGDDFFQMGVVADRIFFGPGTAPSQYHEMVPDTVPLEVSQTLESQLSASARNVIWGVTLPAGTTQQLRRFVQTNYAGSLVITADAQLELAGSGGA